MTTTLLQSLGLRALPATARQGSPRPGGAKGPGPTGPIKPGYADPPDEVRAPQKGKGGGNGTFNGKVTDPAGKDPLGPLNEEQVQKILSSLPDDPVKRTEVVADAVNRISDKTQRDPIARGLRDWLARKQPFTSDANARKKLDEGIRDLVDKGIKKGLLELVSGLLGRDPAEIDREKRGKDPITRPENDIGEHIGKSPEFDLPIDKPGKVIHTNFEFLSAPTNVMGGKYIAIKLRTPTRFKPGVAGAAYVAISSKADFDAKSPHRESDVKIDSKGDLSLSIVAPLEAGAYVMYVVVGPGREDRPVHEFSVTVATPGTKVPTRGAMPTPPTPGAAGDTPNPPEKKNGTLGNAELKDKLKSLPSDPPKRVEALAELVTQVGDAVKRDPIVKALRALIVKIQPVMPDAEAKKAIDDAITDLVGKGVLEGIKALLEGVVGKSAETVDRDAPPRYGPDVKEKDLGVQKWETPPIPFDTPPKLKRNSFEFVGLSKKVKPTHYFNFKLRTPDWWEPRSQLGAGWVVIATTEDYAKAGAHADRLRKVQIDGKGELALSLSAPDTAGRYTIFVVVGSGAEHDPTHEFDVAV